MSIAAKKFWDEEASRWSLDNKNPLVGWYEEHNQHLDEERLLFRGIPIHRDTLALEYGCGPGRNMIKFHELFRRIDGADISQPILYEKLPLNLGQANVPIPHLYHTNGHSLGQILDATYDVIFTIICMQHISCRAWRLELYREFLRVLKPGGHFTFQMGFGPGHPISVDYYHEYDATDAHFFRDTRVEDVTALQQDLTNQGFTDFDYVITDPCHDQHPQWIWVRVRKPL